MSGASTLKKNTTKVSKAALSRLSETYKRVPDHWKYILGLFLAVKIALSLVGFIAVTVFEPTFGQLSQNYYYGDSRRTEISEQISVNMWFQWDGFIYQKIANGSLKERLVDVYKDTESSERTKLLKVAFPPLYPTAIKALSKLPLINSSQAALLISNTALLTAMYFAYQLGMVAFKKRQHAELFVKYLLLLPAAFVFQAAQTESLFIALALASFYYAHKRKWLTVGILGAILATTRSTGFLIALPLFVLLLEQNSFRFDKKTLLVYLKSALPLALIPLGWVFVMLYGYYITGDLLAYNHIQSSGWGVALSNPFTNLAQGIDARPYISSRAWFAVILLIILIVSLFFKKIPLSYKLYGLIFLLFSLSIGPTQSFTSIIRYSAVLFPISMIFVYLISYVSSKDRLASQRLDTYLTIALALLQGLMFTIWVNYGTTYII